MRAPIQLAADVKLKNINLQMWASNELMPGIPDSGMPQTPVIKELSLEVVEQFT